MRYKKIIALFGGWTLARMNARWLYDYTYVHVFDIHICLFLQLDNNLSVEPLELWKKRKHTPQVHCNIHHPACTPF